MTAGACGWISGSSTWCDVVWASTGPAAPVRSCRNPGPASCRAPVCRNSGQPSADLWVDSQFEELSCARGLCSVGNPDWWTVSSIPRGSLGVNVNLRFAQWLRGLRREWTIHTPYSWQNPQKVNGFSSFLGQVNHFIQKQVNSLWEEIWDTLPKIAIMVHHGSLHVGAVTLLIPPSAGNRPARRRRRP